MTIRLVPFERSRLAAMADLWVGAWSVAYPAIDFERRRGWFVQHMAAMAEAGQAVVLALSDGALAGFVTVDRSGWIDQMLVGTAFQGTGVAAALMAEARRLSPSGLALDVNADNARAIAFYRREGFVRTGGRANERGAAIDLMAWRPPPPR